MDRDTIIELCRRVNVIDNKIDNFYAHPNAVGQYGKFYLALHLVTFYFSDNEIDIIFDSKNSDPKAVETRNRFIQTWNHEYCHLYQALSMRAVKSWALVSKNKLKIDTVVLLKHLERGGVYEIEFDKFIQSVVTNGAYLFDQTDAAEIPLHNSVYEAYAEAWANSKWINPLQIIEGMAHIFSKNMSDDPENADYLNLESKSIYLDAYNYYLESGGKEIVGIRIRYIVFCYICFFSCQVDINWREKATFDVISILFMKMCGQLKHILYSMAEASDCDIKEIRTICRRHLGEKMYNSVVGDLDDIAITSVGKIFIAIDMLRKIVEDYSAELYYEQDFEYPIDFLAIQNEAREIYPLIYDDHALLMMMIFPNLYSKITRRLHVIEKTRIITGDSEFTLGQEREFYKLVINYKDFINDVRDAPWCCAEHGYKKERKTIIKCKSEDSFAQIFHKMLNRPLAECVRIPRVGRA